MSSQPDPPMSDFSNVTTPADLVKFNQEPKGNMVEVGVSPEDDKELALTIIEQLYNWHVTEANQFTESGQHDRAKSWAQDAGIIHSVYELLKNLDV